MPLSPTLAAWLGDRGHDAVHATDLGLHSATDAGIMARAKLEARTVITADLDYPHLLALARATEPSVILFRDGDWSEADARRNNGMRVLAYPHRAFLSNSSGLVFASSANASDFGTGSK
jgi:predicted nuclease of predicted toxin-antitoxin system